MTEKLQKINELAFKIKLIATKEALKIDNGQKLSNADYFMAIKIFAEHINNICDQQIDKAN